MQLLALGYIVKFVFDAQSYMHSFLMVALMIVVATLNARKKGKGIKGIT
ncbi:ABC transporter permease [Lysinibacillus agricola]